ncbi:MAG: hypothetical protein IT323_13550 [Anaerolineae bacterium]|nr:hypothetical protein [Anaerolineae bacterium]
MASEAWIYNRESRLGDGELMPSSGGGTITPIAAPTSAAITGAPRAALPLDEFRRIIGFHPYHFWQLADNDKARITNNCNPLVKQYAWQNADAIGRAEILEAIELAERRLAEHLGFYPAPHYVSLSVPFPQFADRRQGYRRSWDAQGRWIGLSLQEGYVQTIGAESLTLIGNANVVMSDADGDGLNDTFTLTIATSVTDPGQIAVYFVAADRFDGSGASDRWRIAPITVSISGGMATIKGRAWTIVRPVLYEGLGTQAVDPGVAGNFASQLSVYRRAVDTTQQGAFVWETVPGDCNTADPSATASQPARFVVRDAPLGIIAGETASYDAATGLWSESVWAIDRPPASALVNVLAGFPLSSGQMESKLATIVARLAAAEMERGICGCETANRALAYWQFDVSRAAGANDEQYQVSELDLDNPLGTRRGQVFAWHEIQNLRIQRGLSTG